MVTNNKFFGSTPKGTNAVDTYAECIAAPGSRIQETFPKTCITNDGKSFRDTVK
jgi:hypothetical protein